MDRSDLTELQGDPWHSAEENHEDDGLKSMFLHGFIEV